MASRRRNCIETTVSRIIRQQAQVNVVYMPEQAARGGLLFEAAQAAAFAPRLSFSQIDVNTSEAVFWRASRGVYVAGNTRVRIPQLHGNEFELGVLVDGTSTDAHDVLAEAWTILGELLGDAAVPLVSVTGGVEYTSTTVIKTAADFGTWLAPLGRAAAVLQAKLGDAALPVATPISVRIPLRMKVRGLEIERELRIERRFYADEADMLYVVSSPLRSDDHEAVIDALFG